MERNIDPFALAREDDGEGRLLALFRAWIAAQRTADRIGGPIEAEDAYHAALRRVCDIEHEIADTPANGPVGFSVKAYMACHMDHEPGWGADPAGVGLISGNYLLDTDPDDFSNLHCIAGVIRDAARFVPEIAELAGPIIAPSPADLPAEEERTRQKLLRAEAGRRWWKTGGAA